MTLQRLNLPSSDKALVIRTDFSDDTLWGQICSGVLTPMLTAYGEYCAELEFINDPRWKGVTAQQIADAAAGTSGPTFVFLVDDKSMEHAEHPILAVDLYKEPGRTFRVIPREVASVEANLSIANLDFGEFADAADGDGVLRGIK